jgi:tetratricopeptide (TPR) repeat protein
MFTVNIYLKFAIIAVSLIAAIVLTATVNFWYALPFYLTAVGFLVSYILLGTIQSAAQIMETQDFEATERRLNLTWKPKFLYVTNRAFFYIIKGSLLMNSSRLDEAEVLFTQANELKLPSDTEKAMVLLQLANINATRNKWNKARTIYNQAKKLKVTEPNLKAQMKQFEKALTNRGQLKHARQGGGMQASKKRGRPRMR